MTIYQKAHSKIDQFPEETVYLFIQLMDKMAPDTTRKAKSDKSKFLSTAGKIDIDENAVARLREASTI